MLRLLSMLAMLAVLGMLISRAAEPASWVWLTGESAADAAKQAGGAGKPDQSGEALVPAASSPAASSPPVTLVAADNEPVTVGTDLDPDESEEATEQFQALTDFSLNMAREEMPSYWRLFRWSKNQTFDQMRQRAATSPIFNQFIQARDKQRGKLFRLDMTVRRVLSYPAAENAAGVEKVYEIVGNTDQSQAWLYMLLTDELPPGMPQGARVNERATFVGYFLKVQGYQPGGAAPTDKPLPAPLLIGRLQWRPAEKVAAQSDWEFLWKAKNSPWVRWIVGTIAVFCLGRLGFWLYRRGQPVKTQLADASVQPHKAAAVRDWLNDAEEASVESARHSALRNADFQNN
jgi:hypothetical protein